MGKDKLQSFSDKKISFLEHIKYVLFGLCIGIADLIPGVSGSTIAFILKFYYKMVWAISNITYNNIKKLLILLILKKNYKESYKFFKELGFKFLLLLVIGVIFSFIFVSKIIHFFLENYEFYLKSFFLILIFLSFFILVKRFEISKKRKKHLLEKKLLNFFEIKDESSKFALSIERIYFFTYLIFFTFFTINLIRFIKLFTIPQSSNLSFIFILFLIGLSISLFSIMPGISGAQVLLALGYYDTIINLIGKLDYKVIPFGIGLISGIIFFSKMISNLMKKYEGEMIYSIFGLIIGGTYLVLLEVLRIGKEMNYF